VLNLNDSATQIAVFNRLNESGPPFYSQQAVMDEMNQIVTERMGLPQPTIFPPGAFTPTQEKARVRAGNLGWKYGMNTFEEPYFFPDKPGGAAAPAPIKESGGNKRIKSKRTSKMRYKKSKKRSNRRRRRYSYKK
jgi:hypothetical protein